MRPSCDTMREYERQRGGGDAPGVSRYSILSPVKLPVLLLPKALQVLRHLARERKMWQLSGSQRCILPVAPRADSLFIFEKSQ